jgi:hypothetical protein
MFAREASPAKAAQQSPRAFAMPRIQAESAGSSPVLRRQICPCGGGCPRCAARTDRVSKSATGEVHAAQSPVPNQRLAHPLQAKLMINTPGDQYEQEADHVAEQVMRMPEPQVQRQCACGGTCGECNKAHSEEEHGPVQMKHIGSGSLGQTEAPPIVHEVLRSPGHPLDVTTRSFMEPRFGHDFSRVRVHTDAVANQSARDVNANAYTVGQNIAFGAGQYAPGTGEGNRLIAHELTHVVQQRQGRSTNLRRWPIDFSPGDQSRFPLKPVDNSDEYQASGPEQILAKPLVCPISPFVQRRGEKDEEERSIQSHAADSLADSFEAKADTEAQVIQTRGCVGPLPDQVVQRDSKALEQKRPSKHGPQVDGWTIDVTPGGLGAGVNRQPDVDRLKVFLGDTVNVRADFVNITKADYPYIGWATQSGGGHVDISPPKAFEGDVLRWVVKPRKVGTESVVFSVVTEVSPSAITEMFLVVVDLQDFTLGCIEAQSTLSGKFNKATRKLNEAATAFREAYGEQEAVLNDLSASDKMIADLAFGVLFAAIGGFVGSALGDRLKELQIKGLEGQPQRFLQNALVDSAKDTGKFVVRSIDRLRHGSSSPTGGDSTAPSVGDPIRSGGNMYKPAGENPLDFLTKLASRVAAEGEIAQGLLTNLIREAKEARRANSKADFDEDPVAVVNRGQLLDEISGRLVTEKKVYLAELWKAWVRSHGWQTIPVYEAICKAAGSVGEDCNDWIPVIHVSPMRRGPGQGPIRPL